MPSHLLPVASPNTRKGLSTLSLWLCLLLSACAPGQQAITDDNDAPETPAKTISSSQELSIAAAENVIRFVAFGDFGTGAKIQYQVAQAIQKKCAAKGCDFAVTLGDNIYNDGVRSVSDPQFQTKFETPFANLPFRFHMVLGNHDIRGSIDAQINYTQHSKKWYLPARYYQFQAGPVAFVALDTNQPNTVQLKAHQQYLKNHPSPWAIAFGHHPRQTNSVYKNSQSPALKQMIDGLCGTVQFYLAGHEHDKQHIKPLCGMHQVIAGSGAGQRKVGRGPNTLFADNSFGFSWFEVSPSRLYFEFVNLKGETEYHYEVLKNERQVG